MYSAGPAFCLTKSTIDFTSASEMNVPCARFKAEEPGGMKSVSPLPSSFSAPLWSRMTRLSIIDETLNDMRMGMFDLMRPVMTSTDGRCVARIRWMPTARLLAARRMIAISTSLPCCSIRSASSSTTITTYGIRSGASKAS